ncbi:MAG: hypothetical protein ACKOE6_00820 [Flammeovirgaceae bacterium]
MAKIDKTETVIKSNNPSSLTAHAHPKKNISNDWSDGGTARFMDEVVLT